MEARWLTFGTTKKALPCTRRTSRCKELRAKVKVKELRVKLTG